MRNSPRSPPGAITPCTAGNDVDYSQVALIQEPTNINNMTDFKQISEELRLAGKTDRLTWLIGGFFDKRNPHHQLDDPRRTTTSTCTWAGCRRRSWRQSAELRAGAGADRQRPGRDLHPRAFPDRTTPTGRPRRATRSSPTRPTHFTDQFAITAGVRFTHEQQGRDGQLHRPGRRLGVRAAPEPANPAPRAHTCRRSCSATAAQRRLQPVLQRHHPRPVARARATSTAR